MSKKKVRKNLLNDVFKYSDKGRDEFVKTIDDEVIDASEVFKCKKKHDKWWDDALKRFNMLNNNENEDE